MSEDPGRKWGLPWFVASAITKKWRAHQPLYLDLKYYREDAEKWFADTSIVEQLLQGLRKAGLEDSNPKDEQ
jgi:hypothetical protein